MAISNGSTAPEPPVPASVHILPELERGLDCWSVFSPLSGYMPPEALNLGQGFMNWNPPPFICEAAAKAISEDVAANHYSIPKGRASLRQAISRYISPSYSSFLGRPLNPETEIGISSGANMAIYAALISNVSPGEEVIVIEPYFDQYLRYITFIGAKMVCIPLRPPAAAAKSKASSKDWTLDLDDLRAAIKPGVTRTIILNTPHNPVGKVFSREELMGVADMVKEHNLLMISDEVYDCLTYPESPPYTRFAALSDDAWSRTITVGSAGKSFSATGWRLGWSIGPEGLIKRTVAANARLTFSAVSPLQEAVAAGLDWAEDTGFFDTQRKEYGKRRAVMMKWLDELGLPYTIPDGSYFILVNIARLAIPSLEDYDYHPLVRQRPRDWWAAWFVAKEAGVVCIPPSDFYSPEHADIAASWIRVAFCKDLATLEEAGKRLQKLKPFIK